jgi:phage-related protein
MFEVILYENDRGKSSVKERIMDLKKRANTDKSARIALHKIYEYIAILERMGTKAGEKYMKHITGSI